MKNTTRIHALKIMTLGAAVPGFLLRSYLYASAVDQKGLIISGHWATRALVGLTLLFLAGLLLLGVFFGGDEEFILPEVSMIEEGCALAGENGIQVGDKILEVDGERVYVYSDFSLLLGLNGGNVHDLLLERDGEKLLLEDFSMEMREFPNEDGTVSLRYGFSFSLVEATFGQKLDYIWASARNIVRMVRLSLKMLMSGQAGLKDLGGPVMIVQQMSEVAEESANAYYAFLNLMYFGAFIAINLAVMNMLPIPALDGGRVVCLLLTTAVEAVTRKKIDPKYEGYLHGIGMILLLILMAVIMFKDIIVWVRG